MPNRFGHFPRRGRRRLLRQGLTSRDIQIIRRIAREFQALADGLNQGDGGDGSTGDDSPVFDPGVILQIADLNLSADAELALSFNSPVVGSTRNAIDRTVVSVSTNAVNLFGAAADGRIINHIGVLRTRDEFEQQILDGFRARFNSPAQNSVDDYDAVQEEVRP